MNKKIARKMVESFIHDLDQFFEDEHGLLSYLGTTDAEEKEDAIRYWMNLLIKVYRQEKKKETL